jgi:hypothetical protein
MNTTFWFQNFVAKWEDGACEICLTVGGITKLDLKFTALPQMWAQEWHTCVDVDDDDYYDNAEQLNYIIWGGNDGNDVASSSDVERLNETE